MIDYWEKSIKYYGDVVYNNLNHIVGGTLDLSLYLKDEVNNSSHQTNLTKYPTPREKAIRDITGPLTY